MAEALGTLADLRREGLIRHLGVSNATPEQVAEAQSTAPIVCVQNMYNLADRRDDELIDALAAQGVAYVPFFPLGGFSPLQSSALSAVAARLEATPMAVALAWLLHRSPNILLIPGTSSTARPDPLDLCKRRRDCSCAGTAACDSRGSVAGASHA